jgi:hypothetical protein
MLFKTSLHAFYTQLVLTFCTCHVHFPNGRRLPFLWPRTLCFNYIFLCILLFRFFPMLFGVRGDPGGWGTALKAGRSRIQFLMVSMEFFIETILRPHYDPGVASNRNEYHKCCLGGKGGRCVGMTNLPPSCADCLEIWVTQTPWTCMVCSGL